MSEQTFSTTDLYLAAYVRAQTDEVPRVTRDGTRCTFHFDGSHDYEAIRRAYYNDRAIRAYGSAIRDMKGMVHGG